MKPILLAISLGITCLSICAAAPEPLKTEPTTPAPAEIPGIVGSSWLVEDIEKKGVIDNARTYIRFESAEKVSGGGGINRYTGPCTVAGNKLTFGPLASTRMAGPPALMDQESAFFAALAEVASFRLDLETGLLYFLDAGGNEILRLSREAEKGEAKPPTDDASGVPDER